MSLAIVLVFLLSIGLYLGAKDQIAGVRILMVVFILMFTGLCSGIYGHIEGRNEAIGRAVDQGILKQDDILEIFYAKPMMTGSDSYYVLGIHNNALRLIAVYNLPSPPCPGIKKVERQGDDVDLVGDCRP
jgi:hypothetical protein